MATLGQMVQCSNFLYITWNVFLSELRMFQDRIMVAYCCQLQFESSTWFQAAFKLPFRNESWSLHFKLISETKFNYTFTCILLLICCPSWLVMSLIRFNLIKIVLFWNKNLKSNDSDGLSWLITIIVFCRANIKNNLS